MRKNFTGSFTDGGVEDIKSLNISGGCVGGCCCCSSNGYKMVLCFGEKKKRCQQKGFNKKKEKRISKFFFLFFLPALSGSFIKILEKGRDDIETKKKEET